METRRLAIVAASFIAGIIFVYSCGGGGGGSGSSSLATVFQIEPTSIFYDSVVLSALGVKDYRPSGVGTNNFIITDIVVKNRDMVFGDFTIEIVNSDGAILYPFSGNLGNYTTGPTDYQQSFSSGIPVPSDGTMVMTSSVKGINIYLSGFIY